jgi:predicted RNA binding protein YcfA (HicA-like mRNA interferase family)
MITRTEWYLSNSAPIEEVQRMEAAGWAVRQIGSHRFLQSGMRRWYVVYERSQ